MPEPTFAFSRALERALIAGKLEDAAGKHERTAVSLRRAAQRYRASMFDVAMKFESVDLATAPTLSLQIKGPQATEGRGRP